MTDNEPKLQFDFHSFMVDMMGDTIDAQIMVFLKTGLSLSTIMNAFMDVMIAHQATGILREIGNGELIKEDVPEFVDEMLRNMRGAIINLVTDMESEKEHKH